jgi:hypothetical protein
MPFLAYFLLLICHLFSGYGLLRLFRLHLKPAYTITLSLLLGVALASFLPFLLQLCFIPITAFTVFGSLVLAMLLLNIPAIIRIRKEGFAAFRRSPGHGRFRVLERFRFRHLYEVPYWAVIGFLILVSVWRCYYLPPTSRDALSGPEAIAEYTVREHTMVNSFFHVDLWSTNNQFKSPFLISLQVIYKLAGFPFGQVWLSIIFISFIVFLYQALKERLHPLLAGLLLLLFMMTPEPYAYTFMILYDYSNMVYFFLAVWFLFEYFRNKLPSWFYFAGFLMGIATYIRSETLALSLIFLPPILLMQWRKSDRATKTGWRQWSDGTPATPEKADALPAEKPGQRRPTLRRLALRDVLFFLPAVIGYWLPMQVYIKYYLPLHYNLDSLLNRHVVDLAPLFQRYSDIYTRLLTGTLAIHLWGYFFYLTAIFFVAEAVVMRRFTREARNWLYAIVTLYLGLGVLGWLLPVMDLTDATKRALFKMLPLALFYLANNQLLLQLSRSIARWESIPFVQRVAATRGAAPGARPATASGKAILTKSGKTTIAGPSSTGSRNPSRTSRGSRNPKKKK